MSHADDAKVRAMDNIADTIDGISDTIGGSLDPLAAALAGASGPTLSIMQAIENHTEAIDRAGRALADTLAGNSEHGSIAENLGYIAENLGRLAAAVEKIANGKDTA